METKRIARNVDDWEKYRRRYYIATATLRMFASGTEYSIITPSVWFYLKRFHVKHSFLGLVLASFQFSSIISALLVGRIYDKTRRTKLLALASNFAEIIGNIVYSLGFSQYLLLFGRFICGLGESFQPVVYGEVGSVIPSQERLKAISFLEGGRALGSVVGPLFNFAFMKVNLSIGAWKITYGSAAGLVMAMFWIMVQVLTYFFIYDMYRERKLQRDVKDESHVSLLPVMDEGVPENEEQQMESSTLNESIKELLKLEVFVVMFADFLFWIGLGACSSLGPLMLIEDLKWTTGPVAGYYAGTAFLLTTGLLATQCLQTMNNVAVLIACCIVQSLMEGLRIIYQYERPNKQHMMIVFLSASVVYPLAAATSIVIGRTLITKLVTVKSQGLAQSVYTIWVAVALMIGIFLGSIVLYHLNIWGSAAIVAYLCAAVLLIIYKKRIDSRMDYVEGLAEKDIQLSKALD